MIAQNVNNERGVQDMSDDPLDLEADVNKEVKRDSFAEKIKKRRASVSLSPETEKLMKLLMTELGIDGQRKNANERITTLFELALFVLEAEMEMARVSTNKRFIDEGTLKDYVTRKYEECIVYVRPTPLFDQTT